MSNGRRCLSRTVLLSLVVVGLSENSGSAAGEGEFAPPNGRSSSEDVGPSRIRLSSDRAGTGPLGFTTPDDSTFSAPAAFPLRMQWRRPLPRESLYAFRQSERSRPIIVDDRILFGTSRAPGVFEAALRDGFLTRPIATLGPIEAPLAFAPEARELFISDTAGSVHCVTLDGQEKWEHESIGPVVSACAIGPERVYYHAVDDSVVALNRETGEREWLYRRSRNFASGLAIFGSGVPLVTDRLVITGFSDGAVVALRPEDGQLAWERVLIVGEQRWTDVDGNPLLLDSSRVVVSAYRGPTVCLDGETGEEIWRADAVGGIGDPEFDAQRGLLFIADFSGHVVALQAETGERVWKWPVPKEATPNPPVLWRDQLVVSASDGVIYLLDPLTGSEQWRTRPQIELAGFSSSPTAAGSCLYAVSDGGWVYAYCASDYAMPASTTLRDTWRWVWDRKDSRKNLF